MRAFNENILESLDDGLLVVDLNDRVVRWNSALASLYGVSHDEANGRPLEDVFDASVRRGAFVPPVVIRRRVRRCRGSRSTRAASRLATR